MAKRHPTGPDLFAGIAPISRPQPRRMREKTLPWNGPGTEPHDYFPDIAAMGDCSVCGHTYQSHLEDETTTPRP